MQALHLDPEPSDPFLVLKATGELDLFSQDEFERVVCAHLATAPVVVDLSGVEFLAISALRSLLVCNQRAAATGHDIYYAAPTAQTRRLLEVSRLRAVLPVRCSVAEVVAGSAALRGLGDQPLRDLAELDVG